MSPADRWPLDDTSDLRDELLAAWGRDGYHDLLHLTEVLDRLDQLEREGASFDRTVVGLAAWFHDAVYAGADDDEERSAQWAERALPPAYADEVARLRRTALEPWAPGERAAWVRLEAREVTGRRIRSDEQRVTREPPGG